MITRFFNTSKPIHFVIITLFTLIVFLISNINAFNEGLSIAVIANESGKYILVLSSIFILNFLVNKNKLSRKNGYEILIYSLLLAMFPMSMQLMYIVFANFFILLALRRIISLRSNKFVKKKLFDAAFWIGIASLFYFWAILFFVLIIIAMFFHAINGIKNWMIPMVGLITVGIITISYTLLIDNSFGLLSDYLEVISLDFTNYDNLNFIYTVFVLGALGLWALFFYVININQRLKSHRSSHILITISFIIGLAIIIIIPDKNGSEFLFIFPPLAIIMANFLESVKRRWLAEVYVWILILTPLFPLVL